jgi:hypothetical protein
MPIIIIATFASIAGPIMAAEQTIEGFQDTRWRMSKSQLQEIYGAKLTNWTRSIGGKEAHPVVPG